MIQRFFSGFGFVFEGRRLLSQVPKLKRWLVVPFIIDFLMLGGGIYFGTGLIREMVYKATFLVFTGAEGVFYNLLYYPLLIIFWLVFIVLYFYVVYIVASVVASPFYAIMAEKTLHHLGHQSDQRSWTHSVYLALRMLWVSLVRGLIMLCFGGILLVASFVPGLNLLAGFCVFIIIALDTMDFSLEAKGFGLRKRLEILKNNFPELCGMAAFVGLTVLIPGLILLVMPIAVVGSAAQLNKMLQRGQ